jgi:hypothetical protein
MLIGAGPGRCRIVHPIFKEPEVGELRRKPLPRTPLNRQPGGGFTKPPRSDHRRQLRQVVYGGRGLDAFRLGPRPIVALPYSAHACSEGARDVGEHVVVPHHAGGDQEVVGVDPPALDGPFPVGPGDGVGATGGKRGPSQIGCPGTKKPLSSSRTAGTTPGERGRAVGAPEGPHEVGGVVVADPVADLLHRQVGLD